MAIIRLTDIVQTMKDKWTYGDKFFGYTEEFNDNHNTQYPSILITPPNSTYPEVMPRNGWENYSFEIYFSDLYNSTQQSNESIEQRWDNLQDLANEWLDMFLNSYIGTAEGKTVLSMLTDEGVIVERNKEVANDKLLQIKMNFGWRVFSKCFTPVSTYPNQINDLTCWLRADSHLTFSIPTKRVSNIGDGSTNTNNIKQTVSDKQPLRYTYDGSVDKTRLAFDNQFLISSSNFPITDPEFTIIYFGKINTTSTNMFGYYDISDGSYIRMGLNATGHFTASVSDGTNILTGSAGEDAEGIYHIGCLRKHNRSIFVDYKSATSTSDLGDYDSSFDLTQQYSLKPFTLGCSQNTDGLLPPATIETSFIEGDWQELIIYEKKIEEFQLEKIIGYLSKKYKI